MKYLSSAMLAIVCFGQSLCAQEPVTEDVVADAGEEMAMLEVVDTTKTPFKPFKLDGVAGVVGEYVILEFDVDKTLIDLRSQGRDVEDISRCQMFESMLESSLMTHHAVQDSLEVRESQINAYSDQQIERFKSQLGSDQKVVEFFKKESMADLRADLFEINKNNELARLMSEKIISEVEVTPEEVRTFFKKIPKDELPTFGVELEIAQIVITPKASEEERAKAIKTLEQYREDIVENGSSFATKAVLYSQDPGSNTNGGLYVINRKTPFHKEFMDVAFSLQPGEVSEPFETPDGFHILTVDKIRGENLEIRHIILRPVITEEQEQEAKDELKLIKSKIEEGSLDFVDAVQEFSTDTTTKFNDGVLTNDITLDQRFELTKLDPSIYPRVATLQVGEISEVFNDPDRKGTTNFKILTVNKRYEEHLADFKQDYVKIKDLALKEKKIRTIQKWQKEKIAETYIKINGDNRDCELSNNWLKKEK
ncbi:peptidylprolyl isomerase [Dokdonia sinensis]|uniref:peptidylprolyl isomerase n=1 Tax=Dokdonia sinensis TaxID=2479847 RepID=UPI001F00F3D3|nr:peptidylprolyl isomerase [Dokdonia sinensis]